MTNADHNAAESSIPSLPGTEAHALLQRISTWGNTTTIVLHGGSVFEFKGHFPKGEMAEGYYNLKGDTGFEGHLKLDSIDKILLQSRKHRGRESHAFVFADKAGDTVFKIFLGRDEQGNLLASQLQEFETIKNTSHHR
jgi:putative heme utilization carrier protein HutX